MPEGLPLAGERPVLHQLTFVNLGPFYHLRKSPRREAAGNDSGADVHDDLELSIHRVEVRRTVFAVEHADHYPEEAADLRQSRLRAD